MSNNRINVIHITFKDGFIKPLCWVWPYQIRITFLHSRAYEQNIGCYQEQKDTISL